MSGSLSEQNALRRSQRVRTNLGLPPHDPRVEDTPRRRSSSSREQEDRTVTAATDLNNQGMQPISESSEDEDTPFNGTFVTNEASRINARAGYTNRGDPIHFDPGEASDRASHCDSAGDLPQGLRSDHTEDEVPVARNPEDEVPSARNPIPETEVGEARPAINENGPGPSTASNAAIAEPATQRGLEVTAL